MLPHLTGLSRSELAEFFTELGEQRYRADQVFRGLHQRRLQSFAEMSNLPKALRERLREISTASVLTVESKVYFYGRNPSLSDEDPRRVPGRNRLHPHRKSRYHLFFVAIGLSSRNAISVLRQNWDYCEI